ncbi:MAG: PorP/SprF family type IX secretion system membrane protein [Salibacteraceae bacterium]
MVRQLRTLLVMASVLAGLTVQGQQDPHLSMFTNNPLLYNPAAAGVFPGGVRFSNNYRVQWQSLSEPLTSIVASVDFPVATNLLENDHIAGGITFFNDETGDSRLTTTSGLITLAYGKALDRLEQHFVSVGFQGGYAERAWVADNLFWESQWTGSGFDQAIGSGEDETSLNKGYFDLNTGIHYFYSDRDRFRGHAGLALYHVTKPKIAFFSGDDTRMYYRYVFHGGVESGGKDAPFILAPNLMYMDQGPNRMFIAGTDFKFLLKYPTKYTGKKKEAWLSLGIYHRYQDALIGTFKLNFGGLTFGASYDLTVSNLSVPINGYGGPEFILSWKGGYKKGYRSNQANERFE